MHLLVQTEWSRDSHFFSRSDPSQAPDNLKALNEKIKEQDAYVVCTSEYNRCIPPALTNFFDHFPLPSFGYRVSRYQKAKLHHFYAQWSESSILEKRAL